MKLLFILLAMPYAALAQRQSLSIAYKPSMTFLGKQSQKFRNYYFSSREGKTTVRSSVAVLYYFPVEEKFGISAGLEYAQQGQQVNFKADSAWPTYNHVQLNITLNYLRIPLLFSYELLHHGNSGLQLFTGVNVGIAVKKEDNYQNIILEDILLPPANKRYQDVDVAIPVGINYCVRFSKKMYGHLGASYSFGLVDAFNKTGAARFGVLSEFDNSKQSSLSLNAGLGINFYK